MKHYASLCLMLLTILLLSFSLLTAAADSAPTITKSGTGVNIPDALVQQLVSDYPDASAIHITAWHEPVQASTDVNTTITHPQAVSGLWHPALLLLLATLLILLSRIMRPRSAS